MNTVKAKVLCVRAHNFTAVKDNFYQLNGKTPFFTLPRAALQFSDDLRKAIDECKALGLPDAALGLAQIKRVIDSTPVDASRLHGEAEHAYNTYVNGLNKLKFVFVSEGLAKYLDNDMLLGAEVHNHFEKAREDIKSAGNCLAVECGTAAVFHLMRVVEYGLRDIASRLRPAVKLIDKGKPLQIEYADWQKVIDGIRTTITTARKLSKGRTKDSRLTFYSDMTDQCEYMKDIWRNAISHTRAPYSTTEALAIMQRVETFMVELATNSQAIR